MCVWAKQQKRNEQFPENRKWFVRNSLLFSVCNIIPCRIVSALMCFSAVALAYMLRISLSYAITQMVVPPHANGNGTTIQHPDICPPYDDEFTSDHKHPIASDSTGKYDWSQELQGLILSSFYWVTIEISHMQLLSINFQFIFTGENFDLCIKFLFFPFTRAIY